MFPYLAAAQVGIGAIQSIASSIKASNLPDPKRYTVSPELRTTYNMARRRADEGYSLEERAAFEQMLARQGTATKQMFRNFGLSGAGSAAANIMGIDALNQFAAQGANIRRQNFGNLMAASEGIQNINNMEVGRFNEQLRAEETALGGATQAGIGNMFGGLNSGMNFMQNESAINAYQGVGGSGSAGGAFNPMTSQLPQAPTGTTSWFDPNGFLTSNAPQAAPQVGTQAPTGMYGSNPNFQGGGMGAYGPQPNMGFRPPNLNQRFQGYGMGMYGFQ